MWPGKGTELPPTRPCDWRLSQVQREGAEIIISTFPRNMCLSDSFVWTCYDLVSNPQVTGLSSAVAVSPVRRD